MQLGGGLHILLKLTLQQQWLHLGTPGMWVANPSALPAAPCHTLVPLTAWCWRHWQQGPWPLEGQGSGHVDPDWPGLPSGFSQLQHTCRPVVCHASCPYPRYLQDTNDGQLAMTLSDPCTKILKQCLIMPAVLIPNTCRTQTMSCLQWLYNPYKKKIKLYHHASCPDPQIPAGHSQRSASNDYTSPVTV